MLNNITLIWSFVKLMNWVISPKISRFQDLMNEGVNVSIIILRLFSTKTRTFDVMIISVFVIILLLYELPWNARWHALSLFFEMRICLSCLIIHLSIFFDTIKGIITLVTLSFLVSCFHRIILHYILYLFYNGTSHTYIIYTLRC